jgi:hypothetical protein
MDIASLGNTNTNHTESNRERLARLRAFIAYAEELEAYYFLHYCVYMQKHEEHHKDLKRFREVVLPSIGNENDIRYTTVVATHNELVANDKALMVCVIEFERKHSLISVLPHTAYYLGAFLKLKPVVRVCRRELEFAAENE